MTIYNGKANFQLDQRNVIYNLVTIVILVHDDLGNSDRLGPFVCRVEFSVAKADLVFQWIG
jgi:hypothetical protein